MFYEACVRNWSCLLALSHSVDASLPVDIVWPAPSDCVDLVASDLSTLLGRGVDRFMSLSLLDEAGLFLSWLYLPSISGAFRS